MFDELGRGVRKAGSAVVEYVGDLSRAHYNVAGEYTFSLVPNPSRPTKKVTDFNPVLQFLLFPTILLSWFASLVLFPLLGHSVVSFLRITSAALRLSFLDTALKEKFPLKKPENLLHEIYGLLGSVIGAGIGAAIISVIGIGRIIQNSWITGKRAFTSMMNLTLSDKDSLPFEGLSTEDSHHPLTKYGLGGLGFIIGGVLGFCATPICVIINSARTAGALINTMIRPVLNDELSKKVGDGITDSDGRSKPLKFIVGIFGFPVGAVIGFISVLGIAAVRTVANTAQTAFEMINTMNSFVADEKFGTGITDEDGRSTAQKVGFGLLGFPIGVVLGFVTATFVGAVRVVMHTVFTAGNIISTMNTLAAEAKFENNFTKEKDDRTSVQKYAFGVLGFPIGAVCGFVTSNCIGIVRVIAHTIFTTGEMINTMNRAVLNKDMAATVGEGITSEKRSAGLRFGLGILGLPFGVIIGAITVSCISVVRIVANTADTAGEMINTMNRAVLNDDMAKNVGDGITSEGRLPGLRFGLGILGVPIGAIIGAFTVSAIVVGRVVANTAQTAIEMIRTMNNFVADEKLSEGPEITEKDGRSPAQKYGFGVLGLLIGSMIGFVTATFIGAARVSKNTVVTAGKIINSMNSFVADEKLGESITEEEGRTPAEKYGFGILGLPLGVAIGFVTATFIGIARVGRHTVLTAAGIVNAMNSFVADEKLGESITEEEGRTPAQKYAFGILGLPIGVVIGFVTATFIGAARIVAHTVLTSGEMINTMNRAVLNEDMAKDVGKGITDEGRVPGLRFGLGVLGLPFGAIIGAFTVAAIVTVRVVANTAQTAFEMTSTINSFVADEKVGTVLADVDGRNNAQKYGFGVVGLAIGVAVGLVTAPLIGIVRVGYHTVFTAGKIINSMNNFVADAEPGESITAEKGRTPAQKYGFGILGFPVGAVIGFVTATLVGAVRVVMHTVFTAGNIINTMNTFAAEAKLESNFTQEKDDRTPVQKYAFGLLGLPIGVVAGFVTATFVGAARVIAHTALTTISMINTMNNGVATFNAWDGIKDDTRPETQKYGLGVLGLPLGIVIGAVSASFIIAARTAFNSWYSAKLAISKILNPILADDDAIKYEEFRLEGKAGENRQPIKREIYGFGFPGLIIGGIIGFALFPFAGAGRILSNSILTATGMFLATTNFLLGKFNRPLFHADLQQKINSRPPAFKYALGVVGIPFGLIASGVGAVALSAAYFAGNTWQSFKTLSGSLINFATGRDVSSGLAGDTQRTWKGRLVGGLGYALSAAIVAPISGLIFMVRNSPEIISGILAVAFSPITAVGKLIYKGVKGHRFDGTVNLNVNIVQRFKDLFAALNGFGDFNEGKEIKAGTYGKKGPLAFLRKTFSFSVNSLTEKVLLGLFNTYKKFDAANKEYQKLDEAEKQAQEAPQLDAFFERKIAKLKRKYEPNAMTSKQYATEKQDEVEHVAKFVKRYVNGEEVAAVPKVYSERTVKNTFWGKAVVQPADTRTVLTPGIDTTPGFDTPGQ